MKKALIFGITGQDGSYLAEFLLKKKYKVHGVKRKSSSFNTSRVDHIYEKNDKNFFLHYGDLTDSLSVNRLINLIKPDEIYNLAAQSHVAVSFEIPNDRIFPSFIRSVKQFKVSKIGITSFISL